jgi:dCMP deaminase
VRIDGRNLHDRPVLQAGVNSGCVRIVYGEFYRDPRIFEVAGQLKLELVGLEQAAGPHPGL